MARKVKAWLRRTKASLKQILPVFCPHCDSLNLVRNVWCFACGKVLRPRRKRTKR